MLTCIFFSIVIAMSAFLIGGWSSKNVQDKNHKADLEKIKNITIINNDLHKKIRVLDQDLARLNRIIHELTVTYDRLFIDVLYTINQTTTEENKKLISDAFQNYLQIRRQYDGESKPMGF
jgi:hypothetical protein